MAVYLSTDDFNKLNSGHDSRRGLCPHRIKLGETDNELDALAWVEDNSRPGYFFMNFRDGPTFIFSDSGVAFEFKIRWG